jgi:hypothetical protein
VKQLRVPLRGERSDQRTVPVAEQVDLLLPEARAKLCGHLERVGHELIDRHSAGPLPRE